MASSVGARFSTTCGELTTASRVRILSYPEATDVSASARRRPTRVALPTLSKSRLKRRPIVEDMDAMDAIDAWASDARAETSDNARCGCLNAALER
jgi:hypothetical protein